LRHHWPKTLTFWFQGTWASSILILVGRYDRIVFPRWTVQYKRFAPQAQFVMFEKSGHFPFMEETDETMRILRDFLQKP
jgi:proline iminopeptidase